MKNITSILYKARNRDDLDTPTARLDSEMDVTLTAKKRPINANHMPCTAIQRAEQPPFDSQEKQRKAASCAPCCALNADAKSCPQQSHGPRDIVSTAEPSVLSNVTGAAVRGPSTAHF